MMASAGYQAEPAGRGLSPSLPIAPALITPDPPIYDQVMPGNSPRVASGVFASTSLPQVAEHPSGSTLPQWSQENGDLNPPPMVAEDEDINPPQNSETNPPPMVAEDEGEKPRRICPLPSIPGITWKPKTDGSHDCYYAQNGRFTAKPQYIGRVGKRLLTTWTAEYGKPKRLLRPVVEAWVKGKKREKGIR